MRRVESSAVEAVDYKERARRLIVTYSGGATYAYAGVPRASWDALLGAESIGRFVNLEIKPRFPARRLTSRSGSAPQSTA
jgi:hypothetical protein